VFVVTTLRFAARFNSNVTQLLPNSERLQLAIDALWFRPPVPFGEMRLGYPTNYFLNPTLSDVTSLFSKEEIVENRSQR
jgi:hypothetical protein